MTAPRLHLPPTIDVGLILMLVREVNAASVILPTATILNGTIWPFIAMELKDHRIRAMVGNFVVTLLHGTLWKMLPDRLESCSVSYIPVKSADVVFGFDQATDQLWLLKPSPSKVMPVGLLERPAGGWVR